MNRILKAVKDPQGKLESFTVNEGDEVEFFDKRSQKWVGATVEMVNGDYATFHHGSLS